MGDILLSTFSGGSDGTTVSVFRQFGHKKQFRAHLHNRTENNKGSISTHRSISPNKELRGKKGRSKHTYSSPP